MDRRDKLASKIVEVSILPYAHNDDDQWVNASTEDLEIEGWNVHTVDRDGEVHDDDDFETKDEAMAHARKLADKHGVDIDHRY